VQAQGGRRRKRASVCAQDQTGRQQHRQQETGTGIKQP
jgi:hypothetical protein